MPPVPARHEGSAVRVLIVSEVAAERLRAASALALRDGIEVVESGSGEEARRQVIDGDDHDFDVLVVDGDLQPRGGFALLYDLREKFTMDGRALPPSIVLTDRAQDRFLVSWSGADRSISKPVDPFELARLVGELVPEDAPA
jgi:DNA-binding response OmpR family regulator